MNICVIGGGGREHAIIKAIKSNPKAERIYALPGNGGIAQDATCADIQANDIAGAVAFCVDHDIGFCIVAPDDPLVLGMVDEMEAAGIPCFGPNAKAALIEGSKVFSKNLMKKYAIPTAAYEVFQDAEKAIDYLRHSNYPIVIKADGLALGKGVLICETRTEAEAGVRAIMRDKQFGESGNQIVIEECLTGPEVSVLAFTDGKTLCPMVSSMDHKRALDGDQGKNTGGMGTIAPNPFYGTETARRCMSEIFVPTMNAMNAEGRTFKGCLYFGLMLTAEGPKVIEYNCRFGDPEAQVVLPLLDSDLLDVMMAVREERLAKTEIRWKTGAACCVMVVSGGYPEAYKKGCLIETHGAEELATIYHSGTAQKDGQLVTAGGRVIGVTAVSDTLAAAVEKAYEAAERIAFDGAYMRHDIGKTALQV